METSNINLKFNDFLSSINESLDMGIEPGMASNSFSKETNRKKDGKATIVPEMTGDETTVSIGDQKEDELKKNGISLTTFKSKKFI